MNRYASVPLPPVLVPRSFVFLPPPGAAGENFIAFGGGILVNDAGGRRVEPGRPSRGGKKQNKSGWMGKGAAGHLLKGCRDADVLPTFFFFTIT